MGRRPYVKLGKALLTRCPGSKPVVFTPVSSRFQLSVLERILRLGRAGGTPGDLDKARTRRLLIWKVCGRWSFCLGTELPDAAGAAGPGTAFGGVGRRFPLEK